MDNDEVEDDEEDGAFQLDIDTVSELVQPNTFVAMRSPPNAIPHPMNSMFCQSISPSVCLSISLSWILLRTGSVVDLVFYKVIYARVQYSLAFFFSGILQKYLKY